MSILSSSMMKNVLMEMAKAAPKAPEVINPIEKAASDFVKGVSNIIPGETKTGQTALFHPSAYTLGKVKSVTPPFKATGMGRPAPGSSAKLARQAELVAKRKAKKPVPGSITSAPPRVPIQGPKSSGVSRVDDLFGAGDKPLGFM